MFNRILVPLDGSSLAERAIPHAIQFAHIFGSSITLLQVLDPASYHENANPVDPLSWQIRKAEADMYLNGIATQLRKDTKNTQNEQIKEQDDDSVAVDYAIREGRPAENIVNFAHTENIDLLIICSHGASGLSRWNISGITQKVINLIYLPVLLIRAYVQPIVKEARIHYRRILLPIDSSRRAECALSAGIAIAQGSMTKGLAAKTKTLSPDNTTPATSPSRTKLILTAVIKPPELPIPKPYPIEIEQLFDQFMQVNRQAVSNYLYEMKDRISVDCEIRVIENASVSSAIHEMASEEEEVDLVILCAHGYTGRAIWPYGNVTQNYIEHGSKPVLVIQDVPRSQFQPTPAEIAAGKTGGR